MLAHSVNGLKCCYKIRTVHMLFTNVHQLCEVFAEHTGMSSCICWSSLGLYEILFNYTH